MVAGSAYWESDRTKRKEFDELYEEKKRTEKRDAWIKELEVRDAEDQEYRRMRDRMITGRGVEDKGVTERQAQAIEQKIKEDGRSSIRSVLEHGEGRNDGRILRAARDLWNCR